MASDNALLVARSNLANTIRNDGSAEAIAAARDALAIAKAERLREDADAILAGVRDRTLIDSYADAPPVTRQDHDLLYARQYEEATEFRQEHGVAREWTDEDRQQWAELLQRHTAAHVALGCSRNAPCRMRRS